MNNQRSKTEQLMLMMMLVFGASLLYRHFFEPPSKPPGPVRQAPALSKAFAGIDPQAGSRLTETAARTEVDKLQKEISADANDEYSYWARLRVALIQQYILGNLEKRTRASGFLGMGGKEEYYPYYDEIMWRGTVNAIEAQAIYQQGDLFWRESTARGGGQPSYEATTTLAQLIHRGRGSAEFNALQIYVPRTASTAGSTQSSETTAALATEPQSSAMQSSAARVAALPAGFVLKKVGDLSWTEGNPNPPGILARMDQYYSTTFFHKLFITVAGWFGNNPNYSYGLTILLFALVTRLMVQPLNKKQYESMKGMAVIAPEMKKIQEKFKEKQEKFKEKGDTQAQSQAQVEMIKETRALQQRHGVNPMMGCGLAIVQMPIFFLVVLPFIQHNEPKLELVKASFGWVHNLARPDIPLLIIYGISMLLSFRLSTTPPADDMQRQQQAIMSFIFPVMLPFFMMTYSAAFILYWITYNLLSTVLQYRMMKAADPEKSVIKTLMGTAPALPAVEAVPPRPHSDRNSNSDVKGGAAKPASVKKQPASGGAVSETAARPDASRKVVAAANTRKAGKLQATEARDGAVNGTLGHGEAADDTDMEIEATRSAANTPNGVAVAPGGGTTHHSQQRNSQRSSQRARRRRRH
ncbi:MAG TPA: YidC/Oxa1 family membrane protein insertase [Abditibacteriaceae bacterium]|nr:YidC/Oxa1 family membrane protein insertase [Abditibacteriaceae bacterium]